MANLQYRNKTTDPTPVQDTTLTPRSGGALLGQSDPRNQGQPTPGSDAPPPVTQEDVNALFNGTSYAGAPELQNILQKYLSTQNPDSYPGGRTQWLTDVKNTIDTYAGTFNQMFTDKVGRPPTADEYNTFLQQVVTSDAPWATAADYTKARSETASTLSDFFQSAAQTEAQKKLDTQAQEAVAPGSAFDVWSQNYAGSINDVEKSLMDYQSKLMEKIRPQLLTSLQSQGLLDTGGLNQAFAGQASDFANTAANYVAGLRGQAAQDIANQKYALMSAPTSYKLNTTMASVPNMMNTGATQLQNVWQSNLMDKQLAAQERMYEQQLQNQPSLLQQYGGMMLGGMAGGMGQGLGRSFFKP